MELGPAMSGRVNGAAWGSFRTWLELGRPKTVTVQDEDMDLSIPITFSSF